MNELDRISADIAVRNLIARYALLVDDRKIEQCTKELFTPDAQIVLNGQPNPGHAGILAWFQGLAKSPPGKHVTVNALIDVVDATHAKAVSDFIFVKSDGGAWKIVAGGRYTDACEKANGVWRFTRRDIVLG